MIYIGKSYSSHFFEKRTTFYNFGRREISNGKQA